MITPFRTILFIVCSTFMLVGCSRKKDKFISRNFHAVATEFNTLYNGYLALEKGREELNQSYNDNYWDILPVERMQVTDEINLPGDSKNPNFNRAEEKAVKAIQKHSMNIGGKERNPQTDEAYLLLGKARYFDQRFIPALEAFNYILYKYPSSDKINQAIIWREKTNMRLDNDDVAIRNLKRLLKQADLENQDLADATSTLAQAYLNTKVIDTAIAQLKIAVKATKSNDERGRYHFIQGQLYNLLGFKDSANMAFDNVIKLNRRTSRIYFISAHIEKIKNFDFEKGDTLMVTELLAKLEKNRENKPYLDKIYHQIAEFKRMNAKDSVATLYYNKSLQTNSTDKQLAAKNYEILGDMNFDKTLYQTAGDYYDSTMANLTVNSKLSRIIKRKRDNLTDVIYYEGIAKANDSILSLVNMSETDRISYFETYIEKLKKQAEEDKKKTELLEAQKRNNSLASANGTTESNVKIIGGPPQSSSFYFYNPTTVSYGKNEFSKVWGTRPNEDNWRWSNKQKTDTNNETSKNNNDNDITESESEIESKKEEYTPEFYLSKLPTEEKAIDSISKERNEAYYQLGLIYKEKFKEYTLAKNKFEKLLESNPEEKVVLSSKYHLYKIYEILKEQEAALALKSDIISNYPDSRYAEILSNPEQGIVTDENSPECLYENLYIRFENQDYVDVISECDQYIKSFYGDLIVPKFEMLKATAIGRLNGYEAYKEAINNVAVAYANTDEGKEAKQMQTTVLPVFENPSFVEFENESKGNYKVIFEFKDKKQEEIYGFNRTLNTVLQSIKYYNLTTSVDVYNSNTIFVVVHGFPNGIIAENFDQLLSKEDKKKIKLPYFVIESPNYSTIQIHKNLEAYLETKKNK